MCCCPSYTCLYDFRPGLNVFCSQAFLYKSFSPPRNLYGVFKYTWLCKHPVLSGKIFLYVFVRKNVYAFDGYFADKIEFSNNNIYNVKHQINIQTDENHRIKLNEYKKKQKRIP